MNDSFTRCSFVLVCGLAANLSSCMSLSPSDALSQLQQLPGGTPLPATAVTDHIARVTKETLEDSYFDATYVRVLLNQFDMLDSAKPLEDSLLYKLRACSQNSANFPSVWKACNSQLRMIMSGVPNVLVKRQDAVRLIANILRLSVAIRYALQSDNPATDSKATIAKRSAIFDGVRMGAREAIEYLERRHWHRAARTDPKPHNFATVISGGSANGAFAAGVIYRMLMVAKQCHDQKQCDSTPVPDLAIGTSTGTLISTLIDEFATSVPLQQVALATLKHFYTCSVDSKLYCINKDNLAEITLSGKPAGFEQPSFLHGAPAYWNPNITGLVRFSGIQQQLTAHVTADTLANPLELIATTVDYQSGLVVSQSDQDPMSFDSVAA